MDAGTLIAVGAGTAVGVGGPGFLLVFKLISILPKRQEHVTPLPTIGELTDSVEQTVTRIIQPILVQQTQILDRIERGQDRMRELQTETSAALRILSERESHRRS